jgi:hypothetical protein
MNAKDDDVRYSSNELFAILMEFLRDKRERQRIYKLELSPHQHAARSPRDRSVPCLRKKSSLRTVSEGDGCASEAIGSESETAARADVWRADRRHIIYGAMKEAS